MADSLALASCHGEVKHSPRTLRRKERKITFSVANAIERRAANAAFLPFLTQGTDYHLGFLPSIAAGGLAVEVVGSNLPNFILGPKLPRN